MDEQLFILTFDKWKGLPYNARHTIDRSGDMLMGYVFAAFENLRKVKADKRFSNRILCVWPVMLPLKSTDGLQHRMRAGMTSLPMHSPNGGNGKGLETIMNDHDDEAEKARQLKDDLQKAALNLINHSGTHNFRIRIEGSMPTVYITLGEGRSSYSADSVVYHGPHGASPFAQAQGPVPEYLAASKSAQRVPLIAYFSKLKKALAA